MTSEAKMVARWVAQAHDCKYIGARVAAHACLREARRISKRQTRLLWVIAGEI